jgi:hypothetical protein
MGTVHVTESSKMDRKIARKLAIKLHLEYSNNDVMPLNVCDTREGLVQYLLPLRVCREGNEVIRVTKMPHYCDRILVSIY